MSREAARTPLESLARTLPPRPNRQRSPRSLRSMGSACSPAGPGPRRSQRHIALERPWPVHAFSVASLSLPLGYTEPAVAKDRTLLGGNLSVVIAQGQGRRCANVASPYPLSCLCPNATNPRGLGAESPASRSSRRRRIVRDASERWCFASHVNAPVLSRVHSTASLRLCVGRLSPSSVRLHIPWLGGCAR